MQSDTKRGEIGRIIALVITSLAALAALIAVRGPDALAMATAEATGYWLLSGPSPFDPLAPFGLLAKLGFSAAGIRGWQNLHVIVMWVAIVLWILPLPAKAWRGLIPLAPVMLAIVAGSEGAGFTGFGLAVAVMGFWRAWTFHKPGRRQTFTLPFAAWLAAWLSPGALILVAAALAEMSARVSRRAAGAAAILAAIACHLTPRGLDIWPEAKIFLLHSPQAAPGGWQWLAFLAGAAVIALAWAPCWRSRTIGAIAAPALLWLGATEGQTACLWAAGLWLIPLWPLAKEELRHMGFNVRWWMQATAVLASVLLVVPASLEALPRWYALAMTESAVRPSLTRSALPATDTIYINPRGLPLARLSGKLPPGTATHGSINLGREPALWRAHDRTARYRAVWLLGDKSDYAPLARHLGESPDWRLAAVDATGVLFIRGAHLDEFATEPVQQAAREMWGGANRSGFLSGAALACLAAHALPESGELSAAAIRNSDRSAPAAAARARILTTLGDIRTALEESARSVALDPTLAEAWATRSEALLHAGLIDDAYAASQKAAALAPGDPGMVWLAARMANAARAFQTEAGLLEQLTALTEGRGGDASFYQLYLGQAYAKLGLARPALRALDRAASAPGLTAEQKRVIDEEISLIRSAAEGR